MAMRVDVLRQLGHEGQVWDVLVIGGGATGLGAAVEAAARGLKTLLVERADFAQGTSSRSTKLAHGGVRYLEQMNIRLVTDALRERGLMMRNAPHLVHDLSFVIPAYNYSALPYYGFGLKVYEVLSGRLSLGPSELLSVRETQNRLPGVVSHGLKGGILYHDGQFDDARFAIALMRTFEELGGVAINYVEASGLMEAQGKVCGIHARDLETDARFDVFAKAVVNATGVWAEQTLHMEGGEKKSLLAVSQGTHFVLPRDFFPASDALMVPKTADGRVLFAIPWHNATLVGTTDVSVSGPTAEPRALEEEKEFLFEHIEKYFGRRPRQDEVLSCWSGLRPLVRSGKGATSKLSRDHSILVSPGGMVTVTGGKWTTYRRMGEDAINHACQVAGFKRSPSPTPALKLHGWDDGSAQPATEWERVYGADLFHLRAMAQQDPSLDDLLHPHLPFRRREVLWAARYEQARTTEDVLARRTRALFMNACAAQQAAPVVAQILGAELGRTQQWIERDLAAFLALAKGYLPAA